jgi:precorrin-3B C17-methyltransferase
MGDEIGRCREAVRLARAGRRVAVVSSGDPGVYGMAGLILEMAAGDPAIEIEIVPGVTAATAAAAALGAPLMCDFAVISLSDLLVPWAGIRRRLEAAAAGDLVAVLYNPRSARRIRQLDEALEIFRRHRKPTTPVGVVTNAGAPKQAIVLTTLARAGAAKVTMQSVVVIGNSATRLVGGRMVTRRGYRV